MPTRPSASRITPSLSSPASADSAQASVSHHLAFVCVLSPTRTGVHGDDGWLTTCYQLTPRLQRFGRNAALLDLGPCTEAEALAVVQALLTRVAAWQIPIRAAIAPSGILAQLALLQAPATEQIAIVTAEQSEDLLRALPVAVLAHLRLAVPSPITAELLARLDGYGIRTLAQLARLDEELLRRQFGTRLGTLLAALARGEDLLPFQPTPAPLHLHYRLRLTSPVTFDRILIGLPTFTTEVATALARRGLQARTLELRLRWEAGTGAEAGTPVRVSVTRTLTQPIAAARSLTETIARLLTPVIEAHPGAHLPNQSDLPAPPAVEDLRLILSDLTPCYPEQHAFWPERTQRLAAAREVAEVLTRRHGKPLLYRGTRFAPDAVFDQNRTGLQPLDADVAEPSTDVAAWPSADVTDITDVAAADTPNISHSTHWW